MLQALAFEKSERKQQPSLNEFVGWVTKHTHQINNLCSTFSFTKCAAIKVWAKPNLRLPPAITPEGHSLKFIPKMSCDITNMFPEYTVDIAYRQTRRWSTKQSKAASKNFWQSR